MRLGRGKKWEQFPDVSSWVLFKNLKIGTFSNRFLGPNRFESEPVISNRFV